MVNAFELITDIVQVINARPNKAKNSYYKALDSRTGVNGKIPLVRISNHKTHCVTWLGDIRDLGTAMRFPANYYFSIVIENEPSQKDENLPVRVKPFTVHEYTFKQEELEQSDIHAIIQDVIGIFTTGEFANSTGKGKYDPVNAKVTQQTPHTPQKESKTNKNMKKNVVKINENTLRKIVTESVKKALNEYAEGNEMSPVPGDNYSPTPQSLIQTIIDEAKNIDVLLESVFQSVVKNDTEKTRKGLSQMGQLLDVVLDRASELQGFIEQYSEGNADY